LESTLSSLIAAAEAGDSSATEALFSALYSELHKMAKRELARRGAVSLSVTTLLHEAYLDMAGFRSIRRGRQLFQRKFTE
jgi:ECF sigma factor